MALDEPKDNDHKLEKDGYTIVVAPQVAQMAGKLTIEQHRWGGVYVRAENGGW